MGHQDDEPLPSLAPPVAAAASPALRTGDTERLCGAPRSSPSVGCELLLDADMSRLRFPSSSDRATALVGFAARRREGRSARDASVAPSCVMEVTV